MRLVTRAAGMCCAVLGLSFAAFGAWALLQGLSRASSEPLDVRATMERTEYCARIAAWLFLGVVASFSTAVGGTAWLASERDGRAI